MGIEYPNILLVIIDCARADKWIGEKRATKTPNFDRLCNQGIVFPTTITEKSFTTPAFSTLLTGLYSPRHGIHMVWGYRLPEHLPLFTHALARNGYNTYAEVTGPMLPEMGFDRGFDRYEYRAPCDSLDTAWGAQFVKRLGNGHYRRPWFVMLHLFELHNRCVSTKHNRPEFGSDKYERAISSLDEQLAKVFAAAGDDSMIVVTGDHGEKTKGEIIQKGTAIDYMCEFLGLDEAEGTPLYRLAYWAGPSVLHQIYGQLSPVIQKINLRDFKREHIYRRWDGLCDKFRMLWLIPRLYLSDLLALKTPLKQTAMLKRRGLLDEVRSRRKIEQFKKLFGADKLLKIQMRMWINSFMENIHEGHGMHVYDYLVRVPLVIRWPLRLPAGAVHHRMLRQPDILPTVLDIIGINPSQFGDIDGRSFKPMIEGKPWRPLPAYVSVTGAPESFEIRGVRTERYKYTFGPKNPELPEELYDLLADPGELHNLAAYKQERCQELRELANSFIHPERETHAEQIILDSEQQQRIEKCLKELGYLD